MRVLDLFAGLGGFSKAFLDRGHEVITIDNNPDFNCTITMDIVRLRLEDVPGHWDIILASPPCTEFAPWGMPESWHPNRNPYPDMSLVKITLWAIERLKPQWWIIENVLGAVKFLDPYLGYPKKTWGSRYLWGVYPKFKNPPLVKDGKGKWKLPPSKDRAALRSKIPYPLSLAICKACEVQVL